MKKLALAAAFVFAAAAAHADPIEGVWQTEPDEGAFAYVTIAPCGGAFCGTITRTFKDKAEFQSPNIGKQIVRSMTANGDGTYAGQVWRPANDKVYKGKATVSGNQMSLAGCVAGGLICKSQNWVKIQ